MGTGRVRYLINSKPSSDSRSTPEIPAQRVERALTGSCVTFRSGNQQRIDEAMRTGKVTPLWQTNLTEITSTEVEYKDAGGVKHRLPNSQVFVFAGGELPTPFLRACGVQIETKFGER